MTGFPERVVSLSCQAFRASAAMLLPVLLGILIMGLSACGTLSANSDSSKNESGSGPIAVEFKVEEIQLEALAELQSQPAGAYWVTENDKTYLVITAGEKPSAGYAIEVKEITSDGQRLQVIATLQEPRPGEAVAQVITYPMIVLSLPDEKLHEVPATVEWIKK